MKNLFFNPKKAEEEKKLREKLELENKEENEYLEILKNDERFQKYIVEKRLKVPIETLKDIMTTPNMSAEQLAKEVDARKSTVRTLQEIFNSIIN